MRHAQRRPAKSLSLRKDGAMRDLRPKLRQRIRTIATRQTALVEAYAAETEALDRRFRETREAILAERIAVEDLLRIENRRYGAPNPPPNRIALADFLALVLRNRQTATKSDLELAAARSGYLDQGSGKRRIHMTLLNLVRNGRARTDGNGRFCAA